VEILHPLAQAPAARVASGSKRLAKGSTIRRRPRSSIMLADGSRRKGSVTKNAYETFKRPMCNHQNRDLEKIGSAPEKMRNPGKTPGVSASSRLSLGRVDRISAASQLFLTPRVAGSNPAGLPHAAFQAEYERSNAAVYKTAAILAITARRCGNSLRQQRRGRRRRTDPSERHAGHSADRTRRLDARALGWRQGATAAVSRRCDPDRRTRCGQGRQGRRMKYAVACRYADRERPCEWPNGARAAEANNQACPRSRVRFLAKFSARGFLTAK
jgi:hypothetical protein